MANTNITEKIKNLTARARTGALRLGKTMSGRFTLMGGRLKALFRQTKARLSGRSGTGAVRNARKAFNRRPPVARGGERTVSSHRTVEPVRYLRGIEAAELFELDAREREVAHSISRHEEQPNVRPRGFFYRHRKGLIAACLVFALLLGGVQYLLGLYTKEDIFISDETQAGNITISDRLTMSDEHADKVKYILILGVDDSSMLTDCIWIMCFDNEAHKMNVMQVPRDTYVADDSSWPHKINAVYASPKSVKWCETCEVSPGSDEIDGTRHSVCGTKLVRKKESNISALIRVINDRLGLPIDHFVIFNFRGFAKIIDTMGGVDIHLDYRVKDAAIHLEPGDHHLTGWPAVDFMRSRKGFANGDVGRVSNQRILIDALMQKALNMDLASMLDVVITCANANCFQTDMSLEQIKDIAVAGRQMSVENLQMVTMPGYDFWPKGGQSYYVCDEAKTAEMINQYLLPYGLPDGSMASTETINFPKPDAPNGLHGDPDVEVTTTPTSTTAGTTTTTERDDEPIITTPSSTEPTEPTGGDTTSPSATESTTTTESTTEPTTTTTEATTTTTTTTAAPTTTTTTAQVIIVPTDPPSDEGEAVGGSATVTPLSDPRA